MEQIIDGPAVHEIGADQSGKNDRACDGFLSGLSKAQQQERYQCDSNLDADSVLGGTDKPGDLKRLLDPPEEQFDRPTSAVEIGDLVCAGIEIVR